MTPNQSAVLAILRTALLQILPPGTEVVQSEDNRVPEPKSPNYVIMTPLYQKRLSTNVDLFADVAFTGSISGSTLTVTSVAFGTIGTNATLFGTGVAPNTTLTGTAGGTGIYTVTPPQNIPSQTLAAGVVSLQQNVDYVVQIDVYGDASSDNAGTISTVFRDSYGHDLFLAAGTGVAPLYADDPRQFAFVDDQQQYERRWSVEAHLQVNEVAVFGQQFAGALTPGIFNVDAEYPP